VPGERILIVENDMIIGRMLELLLKTLGYVVTDIVENGPDALAYATIRHPDLVVIDTSVSDRMDGIEIAYYLTWMFNFPVIFLSGDASVQAIARAKQAKPLGYLVKPIEKEQLFSTIEIGLNLVAAQKSISSENHLRDSIGGLLQGDGGIICLNKREGVILMNPVAEFIAGTTTRSAFLSSVRDTLRFPDEIASSLFADSLVQASRGTPSVGKMKDLLVRSKDGSTKSVSLNVLPVRKTDNEIIGMIVQVIFTHSATMRDLMQKYVAV
jgi:CheY-like chemotaxis protein